MPVSIKIGKITAHKIPFFKLPPIRSDTMPTKVGPPAQPRSPARAKKANRAVPPLLICTAARLKVPGHRIPTEKPQIPQPMSPITGQGEQAAVK